MKYVLMKCAPAEIMTHRRLCGQPAPLRLVYRVYVARKCERRRRIVIIGGTSLRMLE